MCGLEVTVTDGEITKLRPDGEHPVSKGFACNKGLLGVDIHHDPTASTTRSGALTAASATRAGTTRSRTSRRRLRAVIDQSRSRGGGDLPGQPHRVQRLAGPAGGALPLQLGSTRIFIAATQDCANKFADRRASSSARRTSTRSPTWPAPTTSSCSAPTRASRKASFLSVPDPIGRAEARIASARRHGLLRQPPPHRARPRRDRRDPPRHRPLPAGRDALRNRPHGGFDLGAAGDHGTTSTRSAPGWPPTRPSVVAPVVGVDADQIQQLAPAFATAPTAAVHMSTGLNMGRQGALAYFLVQMLSLVTGNLDRPGGNVIAGRAIAAPGVRLGAGAESLRGHPVRPGPPVPGRPARPRCCRTGSITPTRRSAP